VIPVAEIQDIELLEGEVDAEQSRGFRIIGGDFCPCGGPAGAVSTDLLEGDGLRVCRHGGNRHPITLSKPIPTASCSNFMWFPPGCSKVIA
jgi:hypothetical protein